jgi:hypothetical protein
MKILINTSLNDNDLASTTFNIKKDIKNLQIEKLEMGYCHYE